MQKVKHIPQYTYEDYKNWQGDWELIEGLPFAMSPSANAKHQYIQGEINFQIKGYLKKIDCRNRCFVYNDLDWILDEETILRPDISIVCGEKIQDFIRTAPTLIVEVLSPSTAYNDRIVKKGIYEIRGVKFYLIADPETKKVTVHELVDGNYREVTTNTFKLDDKCRLSLKFDEIWE